MNLTRGDFFQIKKFKNLKKKSQNDTG